MCTDPPRATEEDYHLLILVVKYYTNLAPIKTRSSRVVHCYMFSHYMKFQSDRCFGARMVLPDLDLG